MNYLLELFPRYFESIEESRQSHTEYLQEENSYFCLLIIINLYLHVIRKQFKKHVFTHNLLIDTIEFIFFSIISHFTRNN